MLDAYDSGGVGRLRGTGPASPQLTDVNQTASLPGGELIGVQEQDAILSRALFYIQAS